MSHDGPQNTWLSTAAPARGVVLLTHGLNNLPASLDPLGRSLSSRGFEVFRPCFSGHRGNNDELFTVTGEQWESDARHFHDRARARAEGLGVPLHHVAYSMSALIYGALPELRFSKRVLFAPALALHRWYPAVAWLAGTIPWYTFRSRIPEGYGANPRGSARSGLAMHHFHRRWNGKADPTPTLIWVDPRDELVSAKGLARLAATSPAWELREVSTEGCTLTKRFHHLIVGESAVGAQEWARLCRETADFL